MARRAAGTDALYFDEPEEDVPARVEDGLDGESLDAEEDGEVEEEEVAGAEQERQLSAWPQSYRQSMDIYSHMASPNIALFSPLSTSRSTGASYLTPGASQTTRRTPHMADSRRSQPRLPSEPVDLQVPEPSKLLAEDTKPLVQKLPEDDGILYYTLPPEQPQQGSSFVQALLNGVNVLAGVGVLSTPYALVESGWIGLLLLFGFAACCCYTGLVLQNCLKSRPGLQTYPDIGEAAFGQLGRLLISACALHERAAGASANQFDPVVLYFELYACCVEFIILEGDNLGALFPNASISMGSFHLSPRHVFVLVSALAILPTVWLRDLTLLAYVSAGGVLASVLVVLAVFWVGAFDGVGFHERGPIVNVWGFPVSVGLFGFCYSGHAVFPNIYSSMRNPKDFSKVLQVSFVVCTLIYGGMAVMGFTMFGTNVDTQITLSLPHVKVASKIAVWTTVVNPFTKYALTMTPVALSLEELLPMAPDTAAHRGASLAIRTLLVATTVCVALLIPFFGYVMAFIGSFLSMTVSLILPCACYLCILGVKATRLQASICSMVMLLGLVCAVAGTYSSVAGIITSMQRTDPPGLNLFRL